jgi:myo-inositol 2-dehydrogenase / D-chiro-inositol 1-dehydrogenase
MTTAEGRVLRAGLIGAGWIGQQHAETLADRDDVALAAVCDLDAERAGVIAAGAGAEVFTDWQRMLAEAALDLLWVCVPPAAHAGPAVAALDRGIPLYLEKPIARSLDDAEVITAAAARTGTVCAVGYQWHALGMLDDARQVLDGRPVGCLAAQSVGWTQSRPWFLNRAQGGGNLLERGSHHIDLARALAGEVVAVQAAASSVRLAPHPGGAADGVDDIDDAVTLVLHFSSGGVGTILIGWTSDRVPGSYWVQAWARDATVRLDLDPEFRLSGTRDDERVTAQSSESPFRRSADRFITAARAGDPGLVFVTPPDASRTLAVASAAEEALLSGQVVAVQKN